MNYDRLLTRVFDKQEGKMIYPGTEFKYGDYEDPFIFQCIVDQYFMCCSPARSSRIESWAHLLIPFGDRFVPMMCSGKHDANDTLIYEGDIIKTSDSQYLIYWRQEYYGFLARCLTETLDLSLDNFEVEEVFEALEIIGNKWENEKLLEVKA